LKEEKKNVGQGGTRFYALIVDLILHSKVEADELAGAGLSRMNYWISPEYFREVSAIFTGRSSFDVMIKHKFIFFKHM